MLILHPDAAAIGLTYLRAALTGRPETYAAGVTVKQAVPNPRPAGPLVVLRRAGGVASGRILDRPRLAVQVWHADEWQASQLALLVRALLLAAQGQKVDGVAIGRTSEFLGPIPAPDPESDHPRYLLTVEWTLRGVQE